MIVLNILILMDHFVFPPKTYNRIILNPVLIMLPGILSCLYVSSLFLLCYHSFVPVRGFVHRYEDGDTTLRKLCSASEFIWSNSPLEILGSVTSITFDDPACSPVKEHTLTTEEVYLVIYL